MQPVLHAERCLETLVLAHWKPGDALSSPTETTYLSLRIISKHPFGTGSNPDEKYFLQDMKSAKMTKFLALELKKQREILVLQRK